MAKKIGLNLGKREIKPAVVIEETHASPTSLDTPKQPVKIDKNYTKPIARRRRAKKDWIVKSIRMERSEFDAVESYMKKNNISFNALMLSLLEEKGILSE